MLTEFRTRDPSNIQTFCEELNKFCRSIWNTQYRILWRCSSVLHGNSLTLQFINVQSSLRNFPIPIYSSCLMLSELLACYPLLWNLWRWSCSRWSRTISWLPCWHCSLSRNSKRYMPGCLNTESYSKINAWIWLVTIWRSNVNVQLFYIIYFYLFLLSFNSWLEVNFRNEVNFEGFESIHTLLSLYLLYI